jgi:hypothetical protein
MTISCFNASKNQMPAAYNLTVQVLMFLPAVNSCSMLPKTSSSYIARSQNYSLRLSGSTIGKLHISNACIMSNGFLAATGRNVMADGYRRPSDIRAHIRRLSDKPSDITTTCLKTVRHKGFQSRRAGSRHFILLRVSFIATAAPNAALPPVGAAPRPSALPHPRRRPPTLPPLVPPPALPSTPPTLRPCPRSKLCYII